MFHTVFNTINTIAFLPFAAPFAAFVKKLVKSKGEEELEQHLKHIDIRFLDTPALSLASARQEIQRMVKLTHEMFDIVMASFNDPNGKVRIAANKVRDREAVIDMLEKEITDFLAQAGRGHVSGPMAKEIAGLITSTSDLERIGDHCESLFKLVIRKQENKIRFTENADAEVAELAKEVKKFLSLLEEHMASKTVDNIMKQADEIENEINRLRWQIRDTHIRRLNEGTCKVVAGLIFHDMITSFEKIGDHAYNVAEVISGVR
jgi:phosphate:Na+ symporter